MKKFLLKKSNNYTNMENNKTYVFINYTLYYNIYIDVHKQIYLYA